MRAIPPLLFTLCLLALPGCIVQDIHDQIALSNENLAQIKVQMSDIERRLEGVNERVDALQHRLDETNTHLESLRRTINNIDSTIPFLKLSGDDEEEKAALDAPDPAVAEPGPASVPEESGAHDEPSTPPSSDDQPG